MKRISNANLKWIIIGIILLVLLALIFRSCGKSNTTVGDVIDNTNNLKKGTAILKERGKSLREKIFGINTNN